MTLRKFKKEKQTFNHLKPHTQNVTKKKKHFFRLDTQKYKKIDSLSLKRAHIIKKIPTFIPYFSFTIKTYRKYAELKKIPIFILLQICTGCLYWDSYWKVLAVKSIDYKNFFLNSWIKRLTKRKVFNERIVFILNF